MKRALILAVLAASNLTSGVVWAADRLAVHAEDTPGVTRVEINVGDIPFSLEKPEPGVIDFVTPYRFASVNLGQLISGGSARRVANARIVPDEAATRLRMALTCDCGFDFSVSSGVLSVRIKDSPTPDVSDVEVAVAENAASAPVKAVAAPSSSPAPNAAPQPQPRPARVSSASLAAASISEASAPEVRIAEAPIAAEDRVTAAELSPFAAPDEDSATDEVMLARDHLMRQLSRAAEQGLIQFVSEEASAQAPPPEDVLPPMAEVEQEDVAAPVSPQETEAAQATPDNSQAQVLLDDVAPPPPSPVEIPLRVRTAVDKAFTPDRSETRVEIAFCIDAARLDLAAWAQPGAFLQAQMDLRAELLDEFDQPNPEIATSLARHLILNGFGAEARELLRVYGDVIEDRDVLDDLALLVDLKAPDPEGAIARTAPCHPKAALWRAIAGLPKGEAKSEAAGSDADIAQQAVDAFGKLPAVTRRILSARLMNNLIDRGDLDLADQLDLILHRSPMPDDEALSLARARLLSESGRLEEAEALYSRLGKSNRPEAHQALILLLDSRISRGAGGSVELSEALGDAAFSARGTPAELPLKVAEIRSRTLTDGASGALAALRAAMERTDGGADWLQDVGHATLEVLEPLDGDVVDYTKAVLSLLPYVSESPAGDPARRQVASVLTDAGLPNLALTYLEPALTRPGGATSLVAARSLLALNRAEEALAALEGQANPKAVSLRMEALERMGRFEEAYLLTPDLSQNDAAERSARALRAGDWADASVAGDTPQRLLAAYMASETSLDDVEDTPNAEAFLTTPEIDPETTLQSIRAVVDASRSTRTIIERALDDG